MIQIIMSTYNGEAYLSSQLDSILKQTYQDFQLLVRDDGSTDGTKEVLQRYQTKDSRISWYSGNNIGVIQSFFELIGKIPEEAEYAAFADQDDIWLPEKLQRAVDSIQEPDKNIVCEKKPDPKNPALYCGAKIIVDEELQEIENAVPILVNKVTFGNALVQNIATGCTCLINRPMIELLQKYSPRDSIMHDWWLYLIASSLGWVGYDQNAMIQYRQHGANTSGAMTSEKNLWKYRLHQLFTKRGNVYLQLKEFYKIYGSLMEKKDAYRLKLILKSQKSFIARMKVIFDREIFRQRITDNVVLKGIILAGKL